MFSMVGIQSYFHGPEGLSCRGRITDTSVKCSPDENDAEVNILWVRRGWLFRATEARRAGIDEQIFLEKARIDIDLESEKAFCRLSAHSRHSQPNEIDVIWIARHQSD